MEHLGNCHGELQSLIMLVECLPFIGTWFQSLRTRFWSPHSHEGTT